MQMMLRNRMTQLRQTSIASGSSGENVSSDLHGSHLSVNNAQGANLNMTRNPSLRMARTATTESARSVDSSGMYGQDLRTGRLAHRKN